MELSLKEKRKYITGADIINFAFNKIIDKKKIVINFYKFSRNQLEIKTSKVKKKSLVATINYLRKKNKIFIVEKKRLIKNRTSFNEDKLIKNYLIKKRTIILCQNNFNDINRKYTKYRQDCIKNGIKNNYNKNDLYSISSELLPLNDYNNYLTLSGRLIFGQFDFFVKTLKIIR